MDPSQRMKREKDFGNDSSCSPLTVLQQPLKETQNEIGRNRSRKEFLAVFRPRKTSEAVEHPSSTNIISALIIYDRSLRALSALLFELLLSITSRESSLSKLYLASFTPTTIQ